MRWGAAAWAAVAFVAGPGAIAQAAEEEALLEFHFSPVPNAQIAIWLERPGGQPLETVFVTQATGKLGIGNRSGQWDFLSSWHAPYGPRRPVLPIWAHRRGETYPAIVFHDSNASTQGSLGFHEGTSSFEPYYCRPLRPDENEAIMDAMTCPSPQVFQSDKGRFSAATSPYPPRNDIVAFEDGDDHPDILMYSGLNELDGVTGATPSGDGPTYRTIKVARDVIGDEPVVAWIEISLEHDENGDWDFDREDDHHVDDKLPLYGVEWLGQPSVVYRVELDPGATGFTGTDDYHGYGDWDGASGGIHPPDSTISVDGGSGADRLREIDDFGELFRFGVYSHGWNGSGGGGTGSDDGGSDGDEGGGGGACSDVSLDPVEALDAEPKAFDRVELAFTLPELPDGIELARVSVFRQPSQNPLSAEALLGGYEQAFTMCAAGEDCDVGGGAGDRVSVVVDQLFGDFTYQFAVVYEDRCGNESAPALTSTTTPVQRFQQIDTFCFVATAAYGANWVAEVGALRAFRDVVLRRSMLGREVILGYYAYGPALARLIGSSAPLRAATRWLLQPAANASAPLIR